MQNVLIYITKKFENYKTLHISLKLRTAVWKNEKFTVTQKNSSNQLFSIFFSKKVTFTKFLYKKCVRALEESEARVNFHNFQTALYMFDKNSVKTSFKIKITVVFTKYLSREAKFTVKELHYNAMFSKIVDFSDFVPKKILKHSGISTQ